MPKRLAIVALLITFMAGPAYPQRKEDILQLMKDMIDLQQLVRQLQTSVDRDNTAMKSLMEKMSDQVNTLSGGLQKINQAVDGVKAQNDSTTRELKTTLTTLNGTVKELQENLSSARGQIGSISREITSMKTTAQPLAGPDDIWRSGYQDFLVGNYDLAISGLQEFISKFPTDPRAAEAQLRIADSWYAQKKFEQAIPQYDIVLQKYPDSDTNRAALLKKGLAQAETNQPQAKDTLNEVVKKYPKTSEAEAASAKLKELLQPAPAQRGRTPAQR
jgi:tol-pal system protein YbgF